MLQPSVRGDWAKSNRGELQQRKYLNEVKGLGLITHNVDVQLDKPSLHHKIVGEMCGYEIVTTKS